MSDHNHFTVTIFILFILTATRPVYCQEYIFVGDPQIVLEKGSYKQNYNTGMYFFYKRHWPLAIEFFSRCNQLTRKRVKHFSPLTWSYIYMNEYSLAIRSISSLPNRKEKQLVRLVLKEVTSLRTKHGLSKKEIDRIVQNKKNLIKKTRANLIAMSKHEIIDYGP
tara:strand:- start:2146 stop:2640 length:495 start_codon:yes stop_codon:yes gene_type:complete